MHKYSKNPLRFYGLQWYSRNFLYNIDQALKMQNGVQYTVFRSKIKLLSLQYVPDCLFYTNNYGRRMIVDIR